MATNVYSAKAENLSRHLILAWLNKTLQADIKKIENLCSGASYCVLMEKLFPNSVQMKRVKMDANQEHQYISNFKILQAAFKELSVEKFIPIERLVKGRFTDNLEFLQWFKKFYNANEKLKDGDCSQVPKDTSLVLDTSKTESNLIPDEPKTDSNVTLDEAKTDSNLTLDETKTDSSFVGPATDQHLEEEPEAQADGINMPEPVAEAREISHKTEADRTTDQPLEEEATSSGDAGQVKATSSRPSGGRALTTSRLLHIWRERDFYYSKLRRIQVMGDESEFPEETAVLRRILEIVNASHKDYAAPLTYYRN